MNYKPAKTSISLNRFTLPALFIDIDDTIIRPRKDASLKESLLGQPLLSLMNQFAVETRGYTKTQAEKIISDVHELICWWHWTDFLRALELNAGAFWQYAYEAESAYMEPVCPELPRIVDALHRFGYRMIITSNNPSSGILHKLRLAGLAENWGSKYFLQYLGACELRAIKSDVEFWKRALAHTGLLPSDVIVIGDNLIDDIQKPLQAGIESRIHLVGDANSHTIQRVDGYDQAPSWQAILHLLTNSPHVTSETENRIAKNTLPQNCK